MRTAILLLLALAAPAHAGTNDIVVEVGPVIRKTHVNKFHTALSGVFVPRNSSGTVTDEAANLGSTDYGWDKAYVNEVTYGEDSGGMRIREGVNTILEFLHTSVVRLGLIAEGFIGGWRMGDFKGHHTFNGTVYCGQGWMLADGDQVTEANYELDPGKTTGDWDKYVAIFASTAENLYLPDMDGKYLVGADATTQDGSSPLTYVGNSGNTVNLQHSHTDSGHTHDFDHNHRWYEGTAAAGDPHNTFNSSGTSINFTVDTGDNTGINMETGGITNHPDDDFYTNNASDEDGSTTGSGTASIGNSLSTAQSIQPHSLEVQYCLRIIGSN